MLNVANISSGGTATGVPPLVSSVTASLASAAPGAFGLRGAFEGKMLGAESKMDE